VEDLGFLRCFSLNKNCLFKLEFSMWSGSVIVIFPPFSYVGAPPVPKEIIEKFLSNSHPIAPHPTIKILEPSNYNAS